MDLDRIEHRYLLAACADGMLTPTFDLRCCIMAVWALGHDATHGPVQGHWPPSMWGVPQTERRIVSRGTGPCSRSVAEPSEPGMSACHVPHASDGTAVELAMLWPALTGATSNRAGQPHGAGRAHLHRDSSNLVPN